MAQDTQALKTDITVALDMLPSESLKLLHEFAAFLRSRSDEATSARIVKLGGLWEGYLFDEEEMTAVRHEAWSSLGEGFDE